MAFSEPFYLMHERWFKKVSQKPDPNVPRIPEGGGGSSKGVNKIDLRESGKAGRRGCTRYDFT